MRAKVMTTLLMVVACADGGDSTPGRATVTRAYFGSMPGGAVVDAFRLTSPTGVEVVVITYGGIITELRTPDRNGVLEDIVLGYDHLAGYLESSPYFGAIVGRYGNRIARGRFQLDGQEYTLATNNGPNHLHGGVRGFDKVVWSGQPFANGDTVGVRLSYASADGEEGYPGTLEVSVTYTLAPVDELMVQYGATTDRATPVNLTQHSYFNLSGNARRDILEHELTLNASRYTPVDTALIPLGVLALVDGTPFDFRNGATIGGRIDDDDVQLSNGGGYDHNFVLDREDGGIQLAARLTDPVSGRVLEVSTTEPGVQFYSGNFLDGSITGKNDRLYKRRWGLCLETQHFPDSPNQRGFPSTILRPGERYLSTTVFAFKVSRRSD